MSHDDFAFEPVRGLPAELPQGEELLWQGSPDWKSLAVRAYHVRKVAVYFAILVAWRIGVGFVRAESAREILISCAFMLALGGVAIAVLSTLAYFTSRATVYSVTSRRVLLRHGIAVPMTMNVPFKLIDSADFKVYPDGSGEIALKVPKKQRVGYLITWPHLRPGFITQPQPSFRALRDSQTAAAVLSAALAAEAGSDAVRLEDRETLTVPPTPRSGSMAPHTAGAPSTAAA